MDSHATTPSASPNASSLRGCRRARHHGNLSLTLPLTRTEPLLSFLTRKSDPSEGAASDGQRLLVSNLLSSCYLPVAEQRYKGVGWCDPGVHAPLLLCVTLGAGPIYLTFSSVAKKKRSIEEPLHSTSGASLFHEKAPQLLAAEHLYKNWNMRIAKRSSASSPSSAGETTHVCGGQGLFRRDSDIL